MARSVDDYLGKVERFYREVLGFPVPSAPQPMNSVEVERFRVHIAEEMAELEDAMNLRIYALGTQDCWRETVAAQADALLDIVYISLGRLIRMGVVPGALFDEVHRANMLKRPGRVAKRPGETYDAVKPEGWTPPDLEPFLELDRDDLLDALANKRKLLAKLDAVRGQAYEKFNRIDGMREFKPGLPPEAEAEVAQPKTQKQTAGKAPLESVPYEAMVMEAEVFAFGAGKYTWDGYIKSPPSVRELVGALLRHAFLFAQGHDLDVGPDGEHGPVYLGDGVTPDPERHMKWSGLSHIGHMRCCTSMLAWVVTHRPDRDDRYFPPAVTTFRGDEAHKPPFAIVEGDRHLGCPSCSAREAGDPLWEQQPCACSPRVPRRKNGSRELPAEG